MSTAPSYFHQWIILQLVRYIAIPALEQGLAFSVPAPVGVIMPGCDPVQPDFVVVLSSRSSIIRDRRIRDVPDLIVEILSRSNASYDKEVKLNAYARAGLPEYAIVDPRARTLSHYKFDASGSYPDPRVYGEAETMSLDRLPAIAVPVGKLFAGAPDTTL
jgi:Uma2 family endonuclease